jgi:hypothetical protein
MVKNPYFGSGQDRGGIEKFASLSSSYLDYARASRYAGNLDEPGMKEGEAPWPY